MSGLWFGSEGDLLVPASTVATVAIVVWAVTRWQGRRRSLAYYAALAGASAGKVIPVRSPNAGGFVANVQPAPSPLARCTVTYHTGRLLDTRRGNFEMQAVLVQPPRAELVWRRGVLPPQVLGSKPGATAWMRHRLDFANLEFAARGTDIRALRHAFAELQTRFGPVLQALTVRGDAEVHIVLALSAKRLDPHDLPALITMVQTIGRAARGL